MTSTTDDFEEFARARTPYLYRTARLLTGDRHEAEDLVQETLAKMFRAWRGLQKIDNPPAYAQTVLVRTFISQRRRLRVAERAASKHSEPAAHGSDIELRLALEQALGQLLPLDRAVLVLRYFEDRSVEQVAIDLGKKPGAIRTRTSRALDRLRDVLGDDSIRLIAL
ncbi:SigE family RNA polymerase sigma factor [Kribbella sp. NPDC055071]